MGIAGEIGEDLPGAGERGLGIDDPLGAAQWRQKAGERRGRVERGEIGKEAELAGIEGGLQTVEKQPAEQLFEHRHGQEKAGTAGDPAAAVGRGSAARDDATHMRMVVEVLPQVWSTAMAPTWAPRCLGSAAIRRKVSAAALNSSP